MGTTWRFWLHAENESGQPVGSITIRYFNKNNRGYGYVDDATPELGMAVTPEHRGQGIGTLLMKRLITEAKAKEIKNLSLSVDPNNPAAKLYKQFDFMKVGVSGTSITMLVNLG